MSRALVGVAVLFVACVDAAGARHAGAKVWFDSSAFVRASWYQSSTFPGHEWSRNECFELTREELSTELQQHLEGLTLSAREFYCVSDGANYGTLVVRDESGTSATYQTIGAHLGCAKPDGGVQIDFNFELFKDAGTACQ